MMKSTADIKTAIERTTDAIRRKPAVGKVTRTSVARMVNGFTCEVRGGDWKLTADEPEAIGGTNSGPTPGDFSRMGLSSCLAIGYALWFTKLGVPYEDIQVELEADMDMAGMLGVDDAVAPGHEEIRVQVNIVSSAPKEEIERVAVLVEAHSPNLDVITRPVKVDLALNVTAPRGDSAQSVAK